MNTERFTDTESFAVELIELNTAGYYLVRYWRRERGMLTTLMYRQMFETLAEAEAAHDRQVRQACISEAARALIPNDSR